MQKALHTLKERSLDEDGRIADQHEGDAPAETDPIRSKSVAPLLVTLAGLALGALFGWLVAFVWTAAAWSSGMRPQSFALSLAVVLVSAAIGACLVAASRRFHRHGAMASTGCLFVLSLSLMPVDADALAGNGGGFATALSVASAVLAATGPIAAALAAAVSLLEIEKGVRPGRAAVVGAAIALALYPFVVEPVLSLEVQARVWMALFVASGVFFVFVIRLGTGHRFVEKALPTSRVLLHVGIPAAIAVPLVTDLAAMLAPVAMPACLVLAVASLAGLHAVRAHSEPAMLVALVILVLGAMAVPETSDYRLPLAIGAFVLAIAVHGHGVKMAVSETAVRVPLVVSGLAGGVTGGYALFHVALPWSPLASSLIAALMTAPGVFAGDLSARTIRRLAAVGLLAIAAALVAGLMAAVLGASGRAAFAALFAILAYVLNYHMRFWPERWLAVLAAIFAASPLISGPWSVRYAETTGWGQLRIEERSRSGEYRLRVGNKVLSSLPSRESTSIAGIIDVVRRAKQAELGITDGDSETPLLAGIVGLGGGHLACIAKAGDVVRYFEADAVVAAASVDSRWFGSFSRCTPSARVIVGDPRKSLRAEPDDAFDVMLVDAAAAPGLPLHLLAADTLAVLVEKLGSSGVLLLRFGEGRSDVVPWVASQITALRGVQSAIASGGIVIISKGTVVMEQIAAWPEVNGLERRAMLPVPRHFDLVSALLSRRDGGPD